MIRLSGQIGGSVHVALRRFEFGIAQIAPQDTGHAQFVRLRESVRDLGNLSG